LKVVLDVSFIVGYIAGIQENGKPGTGHIFGVFWDILSTLEHKFIHR
jgi:hypothetical protein